MATIGRNAAVTELPNGARFKGVLAWYMWLVLHLAYIVGFRSRIAVLVNWIWSYLTYDRHARIIVAVEPQRRAAPAQPAPAAPAPSAPASPEGSRDRPVVG
jgi:NADH dehydrogenase